MKLSITLMALLAVGACKDKDKQDDSKATSAAKTATAGKTEKPKAAAAGPLKLEAFGLSIEVPAGTNASAFGEDSVMLQGPGLALTVDLVDPSSALAAKSLADEVEQADMYSPVNIVKAEVEGGWDMTFENKGGMGTNYWVKSRRTIDGKAYNCGTSAHSKEQQEAALAACKTLKK